MHRLVSITLICVGIGSTVGCTQAAPEVHIVHNSGDMTTSAITNEEAIAFQNSQPLPGLACETHLQAVTCYSDSAEMGYDPACSKDAVPAEFMARLSEAAEELPVLAKKVLCNINRLQIQPKIFSIGYASRIKSENNSVIGNMIGIRSDVLSAKSEFDLWSWKEQLSFGLSKKGDPSYTLSPLGPKIIDEYPSSKYPLFLGVIVHEIGHLLDFMNRANHMDYQIAPEDEDKDPVLLHVIHHEKSFGRLSWPNYKMMSDGSNWPPDEIKKAFPRLFRLCFYYCDETAEGPIDPSVMIETYQELRETSFITSYASSSEQEDFAEAFAYVSLMDRGVEYKIVSPNGVILQSAQETLQSERFKPKLKWVQDFMANPDLIYRVSP